MVTASYNWTQVVAHRKLPATWLTIAAVADWDKTFGERLLEAMKAKSAPTTRVGAAEWLLREHGIEVSSTQITKYVNDDELPRMEQCRDYARALGVTMEWLYTGRGVRWPIDPLTEDEDSLIRRIRRLPRTWQAGAIQRSLGVVGMLEQDLSESPDFALAASMPAKPKTGP